MCVACMCLSLINTSDVVPINRIKWNTQHTGKLVLNVIYTSEKQCETISQLTTHFAKPVGHLGVYVQQLIN